MTDTENKTKLTKTSLPDVGKKRFWRVEHNPKSVKTPVKVTLMERFAGTTSNSIAHIIAFDNTIATPEAIQQCAELINTRAGRVDEMVGDY